MSKRETFQRELLDFMQAMGFNQVQVHKWLEEKGVKISQNVIHYWLVGHNSSSRADEIMQLFRSEPKYVAFREEIRKARAPKPQYSLKEEVVVSSTPISAETIDAILEARGNGGQGEPQPEPDLRRKVMELGLISLAKQMGFEIEVKH